MTEQEFFDKNNCYKITPEGSINTRCPFCGDSQKPNHLYNYGQAYLFKDGYFKCFKCGKYTTAKDAIVAIAQKLRIEPPKELLDKFKVTEIKYIMKSNKYYDYYKPNEEDLIKHSNKVRYIQERTRFDTIDINFIEQNKIILDLDPYHEILNKKFKNIKPNEYVGFMSYNNKRMVLRNVKNVQYYRYLSTSIDNSYDFYAPTNLDEMFFKHKTIIIGEGIFDILNKNTQSLFTGAYISALSKTSILSAIKQIFMKYLLRFSVIILKDRDVDKSFLTFIKRMTKDFVTEFKVYENLAGKDFGDINIIPNEIELKEYRW